MPQQVCGGLRCHQKNLKRSRRRSFSPPVRESHFVRHCTGWDHPLRVHRSQPRRARGQHARRAREISGRHQLALILSRVLQRNCSLPATRTGISRVQLGQRPRLCRSCPTAPPRRLRRSHEIHQGRLLRPHWSDWHDEKSTRSCLAVPAPARLAPIPRIGGLLRVSGSPRSELQFPHAPEISPMSPGHTMSVRGIGQFEPVRSL
jgi:hypothetical protein